MNKLLLCCVVWVALCAGVVGCSPERLTAPPTHVAFTLPTLLPPTPVPPTATELPSATATTLPSPTPAIVLPTATVTPVPPAVQATTATAVISSTQGQPAMPTLAPTAAPTPTPVPATATLLPATPMPAVAPGLYATDMRIDPPPVRGQELKFTVKFLNSMDHEESRTWLVYIFRADTQRGTGETSRTNSALSVGGTEFLSDGSWRLPLGGMCDYFYAQVGWMNTENKVVWFSTPTGAVFQKGLTLCPP